MGDIADAMLNGDMCEGCGVEMFGGMGFPQRCPACRRDDGEAPTRRYKGTPRNKKKLSCPDCGKRVKAVGLRDHRRDAHGLVVNSG